MSDDQFTKLFKYMQGVDKKVDTVIENMATKDDTRRIEGLIDGYAARILTVTHRKWLPCSTKLIV